MSAPKAVPHRQILLALVLGAVVGCLANALFVKAVPRPPESGVGAVAGGSGSAEVGKLPLYESPAWLDWVVSNVTEPVGKVFLNLLIMTVIPLVKDSPVNDTFATFSELTACS